MSSTPIAKAKAYSLLTDKGLIRVGLPMLSTMQFKITHVQDPYSCNTNPATGLSDPKTGIASFYRRPLPSTNLGFLSAIMWDGREPDLFHQSVDATLGHAQGNTAPSVAQQNQIVGFEGCASANNPDACAAIPPGGGLFTAQLVDARRRFSRPAGRYRGARQPRSGSGGFLYRHQRSARAEPDRRTVQSGDLHRIRSLGQPHRRH
jgi:hypothetical protein